MNVDMSACAGWLLHSAAGGGLLLLLTWGLMARTGQPALRQRLGEFGLVAALAVALLSLGPSWLLIPWPDATATKEEAKGPEQGPAPLLFLLPGEGQAEQTESRPAPAAAPASAEEPAEELGPLLSAELLEALGHWAVLTWAAGASLLLARWLLGHVALAQLLRGAGAAPPAVAKLFRETAGRPNLPRLLVSARLRVPVSCGLLRPTVLLPAGLCQSPDPARLRWAFAHELTHLDRRDAWSCLLFGLGQAVFFFLPWFWPVRRQVRLCQEYVADAAAAAQDNVADYAEFLLSLTGAPAVPLGATGVSGHSSDLLRRVTMLLQEPLPVEPRCPRRRLLAAAGALLGLAVVVAGVGVRAEGPTIIIITGDSAPKLVKLPPQLPQANTPGQQEKGAKRTSNLPSDNLNFWIDPRTHSQYFLGVQYPGKVTWQPQDFVPDHLLQFKVKIKLPHPAVESLKKALDRLQQNPDKAEVEKVRKELERVLEDLKAQGTPPDLNRYYATLALKLPPRLGVSVEKPSAVLAEQLALPPGLGLVVKEVLKGSTAEKAGVKVNDILLMLNGNGIKDVPEKFVEQTTALKPGSAFILRLVRKGKHEEIKGVLTPLPEESREDPTAKALRYLTPLTAVKTLESLASPKGKVTTTRTRPVEQFTTRYQEGKLRITVTGAVTGVTAVRVFEIAIQEGDGPVTKYSGVEQVPAQYRDRVRQLIETSGQSQERSQAVPWQAVPWMDRLTDDPSGIDLRLQLNK